MITAVEYKSYNHLNGIHNKTKTLVGQIKNRLKNLNIKETRSYCLALNIGSINRKAVTRDLKIGYSNIINYIQFQGIKT